MGRWRQLVALVVCTIFFTVTPHGPCYGLLSGEGCPGCYSLR